MKRFAVLFPLLACCCNKSMDAAVRIKGQTFKASLVRTREQFRDFLAWDPPAPDQARVVAYPAPRHHHYGSRRGRLDVVFTDAAGKVLEIGSLDEANPEGWTSGVEATHAIFLAAGTAARLGLSAGETVELDPALRQEFPPILATLRIQGQTVHAWTAETPEERSLGFMYRKRLSADDGMIFVYPSAEPQSYWMGNCHIDLDIAFFRADGTLINVVETRKYPDPKVKSAPDSTSLEPAKFVVETNFGWFRSKGLTREDGRPSGTVRLDLPADLRK